MFFEDKEDKNWAWTNYLSLRALQQAENVRGQLQRTMERFEIELVTLNNAKKLYENIRKALVAGFFMQVAHKEGEKGNYLTVKDNQVCMQLIDVHWVLNLGLCYLRSWRCIRHVDLTPNPNGSSSTSLYLLLDLISERCQISKQNGVYSQRDLENFQHY